MEESAGCIIVKCFNGVPHILLAHAAGNWRTKLMGFPKGHVDEGESLEEAAIRETKEEVGIVPNIINYLGSVKTKKGKKVHAYLALVESGKLNGKKAVDLHKEEIDYAKFFPLKDAEQLVYDYQRPLILLTKKELTIKFLKNQTCNSCKFFRKYEGIPFCINDDIKDEEIAFLLESKICKGWEHVEQERVN